MSASNRMVFIAFIFALLMTFGTCQLKLDSKTEAKFAAKVFNALPKSVISNQLISPSGLRRVLAIMRIGARKESSIELAKYGEFEGNNDEVSIDIGHALNDLRDIKHVQSIFYARTNQVRHKWRNSLTSNFQFLYQDFDTLNAADVNNWIRKKSDERIQSFIEPRDVDADTTQLVIDVLNFNAKWKHPFARALTEYFYNISDRYDVEMYEQTNTFLYGDLKSYGIDATAIVLPFQGDQTEMLILLPSQQNGLDEMLEELKDVDITKIKSNLDTEKVRVYFPKLKLNIKESVQKAVENMGLQNIFSDKGNFENLEYKIKIRAKKLQQEVALDSSMTDVSAVAVSSVQWELKEKTLHYNSDVKEKPIEHTMFRSSSLKYLDVDHPFFYAIIYGKHILYAGTIRNI